MTFPALEARFLDSFVFMFFIYLTLFLLVCFRFIHSCFHHVFDFGHYLLLAIIHFWSPDLAFVLWVYPCSF